jgi:hypothetical protein
VQNVRQCSGYHCLPFISCSVSFALSVTYWVLGVKVVIEFILTFHKALSVGLLRHWHSYGALCRTVTAFTFLWAVAQKWYKSVPRACCAQLIYSVYIKSGNTLNYLLHKNYKLNRHHIRVILKINSESLFLPNSTHWFLRTPRECLSYTLRILFTHTGTSTLLFWAQATCSHTFRVSLQNDTYMMSV